MRKKWEKPKLMVLVRSAPEEACLAGCKVWHDEADAESSHGGDCEGLDPCHNCFAQASS